MTFEIHHGDCLEVLPSLERGSVSMFFMDPPYCSGGLHASERRAGPSDKYSTDGKNPWGEWAGDQKDQRGFFAWFSQVLRCCRLSARPGTYVFAFCDWRQVPIYTDAFQAADIIWRGIGVWNKGRGSRAPHKGYVRHQAEFLVWGTFGKCNSVSRHGPADGVVNVPNVPFREKRHQVQKPVGAIKPYVQLCEPGGLVVDPFCGVGSTGVASIAEGLRFVGIDRSEDYCAIARARCAHAAGQPSTPPLPHSNGS
jgi:site-specific DNA-methyltransferase (adenine-specific)